MIIVIPYKDKSGTLFASHGIDSDSLEIIILPAEKIEYIAYFSNWIGEWILK